MKADKQHNALEVITKEQLTRRVFTVEFKAEVVRHRKAYRIKVRSAIDDPRTPDPQFLIHRAQLGFARH